MRRDLNSCSTLVNVCLMVALCNALDEGDQEFTMIVATKRGRKPWHSAFSKEGSTRDTSRVVVQLAANVGNLELDERAGRHAAWL